MTASILLERVQLESRLLLRARGQGPARTEDMEAALVVCRDLPAHCRQARADLWQRVLSGQITDFQAAGEQLLGVLDEALVEIGQRVQQGQDGLLGIQAELEQLRQEHREGWLWFHREDAERALAESARGEALELDDAFAQIAGVSRADWLQRLQEHERRYHGHDSKE